jgi:hypothetical protein
VSQCDHSKQRPLYLFSHNSGRLRNVTANGSDGSWPPHMSCFTLDVRTLHACSMDSSNVPVCWLPFAVRAVGDAATEVRLVALLSPFRHCGRICL